MYPERELRRLAAQKALLRLDIALRRAQFAGDAARVSRPLEWLDRVTAFWRRLPPLAKLSVVPLGLLARRAILPRSGLLGSLIRWGPLVAGAVRGLRASPGRVPSGRG